MRTLNKGYKPPPDLDANGEIKWDALRYADTRERAFMEMWNDPVRRQQFEADVKAWQGQRDVTTQRAVQGRGDFRGETPYRQFLDYQDTIRRADEWVARNQGGTQLVDGADVARMSLEEFDLLYDEKGRPRPGTVYHQTSRDVRINDGVDRATARELGGRRR